MTGQRPARRVRRATHRLRAALLFALLPLAAGCASMLGRAPDDRTVTVAVAAPRPTAVRRALAAFRAQGYQVEETLTSASEMVTAPFRHEHDGDRYEAVFRARVAGTRDSSRITLSGSYRRLRLGGVVRDKEQELRRADRGIEGELWARLENLRLAIRSAR